MVGMKVKAIIFNHFSGVIFKKERRFVQVSDFLVFWVKNRFSILFHLYMNLFLKKRIGLHHNI